MAYKGRRVKKIPIYKKPAFWLAVVASVLILALVIWVCAALSSEIFTVRKPDPTTEPTSQTRPPVEEQTEATLPPPEANPYEPSDFERNSERDSSISPYERLSLITSPFSESISPRSKLKSA